MGFVLGGAIAGTALLGLGAGTLTGMTIGVPTFTAASSWLGGSIGKVWGEAPGDKFSNSVEETALLLYPEFTRQRIEALKSDLDTQDTYTKSEINKIISSSSTEVERKLIELLMNKNADGTYTLKLPDSLATKEDLLALDRALTGNLNATINDLKVEINKNFDSLIADIQSRLEIKLNTQHIEAQALQKAVAEGNGKQFMIRRYREELDTINNSAPTAKNSERREALEKKISELQNASDKEEYQQYAGVIQEYAAMGQAFSGLLAATGYGNEASQASQAINIVANAALAVAAFSTKQWAAGLTASMNTFSGILNFGKKQVDMGAIRHQEIMDRLKDLYEAVAEGVKSLHEHLYSLGDELFDNQHKMISILDHINDKLKNMNDHMSWNFNEVHNTLWKIQQSLNDLVLCTRH